MLHKSTKQSTYKNWTVNIKWCPNVVGHLDVVVGLRAPRTRRICHLEVRSQLKADHVGEQRYYTSPVLSGWLIFGFNADFGFTVVYSLTAGYCDLRLHRGCTFRLTNTASVLGRCDNLPAPKVMWGKVRQCNNDMLISHAGSYLLHSCDLCEPHRSSFLMFTKTSLTDSNSTLAYQGCTMVAALS